MQRIYEILFANGNGLLLLRGYCNTLIITVCAIAMGVVLGMLLAVCKVIPRKRWWAKALNAFADLYITVIRGTPLLVQLFIYYFVVFRAVDVNAMVIAIVGFGINSGAYVAEIMRSGVLSVSKGQMDAGRSLGLSYRQTMIKIILPQAVKNILPALGNEVIMLVKETSVASVVTVKEFFNTIKDIVANTYNVYIPYLFAALVYLITVILLTWGLHHLEKKMRKSDVRN